MAVVGGSCGDRQQEAKQELSAKSFTFTVDEFMRAAKEGNVTALKHFIEAGMAVDVKDGEGLDSALSRGAGRAAGGGEFFGWAGGRGRTLPGRVLTRRWWWRRAPGASRWSGRCLRPRRSGVPHRPELDGADGGGDYGGEVECVKLLAPHSSDSLDEALQIAALQGKTAVIDCSAGGRGGCLFPESGQRSAPLMYAAANGHLDAVRVLLLHGSNPIAMEGKDRTAIDLASEAGHKEDRRHAPRLGPEARESSRLAPPGSDLGRPCRESLPPSGRGRTDVPEASPSVAATGDPRRPIHPSPRKARPNAAAAEVAQDPPNSGHPVYKNPFQAPPPLPRLQGATLAGFDRRQHAEPALRGTHEGFPRGPTADCARGRRSGGGIPPASACSAARETQPRVVLAGGQIGGTGLQLVTAERRFMPSKMGEGRPLDVSPATVVDTATGQRHRIVRNATAHSSQPAALISAGDGGRALRSP